MNAKARSRKRSEEIGASFVVMGLFTWYAGGSSARDVVRDGWPLAKLALALAGATFVAVCLGLARVDRSALGLALFVAGCAALPCVTLSALINRYANSPSGTGSAAKKRPNLSRPVPGRSTAR